MQKFGKNCTFVVIGDGRDEESAAKKVSIQRISMSTKITYFELNSCNCRSGGSAVVRTWRTCAVRSSTTSCKSIRDPSLELLLPPLCLTRHARRDRVQPTAHTHHSSPFTTERGLSSCGGCSLVSKVQMRKLGLISCFFWTDPVGRSDK